MSVLTRQHGLASVLLLALISAASAQRRDDFCSGLAAGYCHMYNLEFGSANNVFAEWQQLHPQDPLGPVSDAAAWLFLEFDRLHIQEAEFFTNDKNFENQK